MSSITFGNAVIPNHFYHIATTLIAWPFTRNIRFFSSPKTLFFKTLIVVHMTLNKPYYKVILILVGWSTNIFFYILFYQNRCNNLYSFCFVTDVKQPSPVLPGYFIYGLDNDKDVHHHSTYLSHVIFLHRSYHLDIHPHHNRTCKR